MLCRVYDSLIFLEACNKINSLVSPILFMLTDTSLRDDFLQVKLLCESGANYSAKLSDGRTALDVARGRSRRSVVDALHVIQLTEAAKKTDRSILIVTCCLNLIFFSTVSLTDLFWFLRLGATFLRLYFS